MLWLTAACLIPYGTEDLSCDPRVLEPGEIRARIRVCTDEAIPNGESRRGEIVIENSKIRLGVRSAPSALTVFNAAGGGIVDLSMSTGSDLINELLPLIGGQPLIEARLNLNDIGSKALLSLNGRDHENQSAEVVYSIVPDVPGIDFEGNDGLLLVPDLGFTRHGQMIISPSREQAIVLDGTITDLGGYVLSEPGKRLAVDTPEQVWQWMDPEAIWFSRSTTADWLEFLTDEEEELAAFPVRDGNFSGFIPGSVTLIRPVHHGCRVEAPISIETEIIPEPQDCTNFRVRVQDETGTPLFARLIHDEGELIIPPSGLILPTSEVLSSAIFTAGNAYEIASFEQIDPTTDEPLDITLRRAVPSRLIFSPTAKCGPDKTNRNTAESQAQKLAAQGIGFAICSAEQVVPGSPELTPHTEADIRLQTGSFNTDPLVLGWPWEQTLRDAGYGAIPPTLDPMQMLNFAAKIGRNTMVDTTWVEENPPPWETPPDFLLLESQDDIFVYLDLLNARVPIVPLAPNTVCLNLAQENHHPVDIERELRRMHTALGNGPVVEVNIDGAQNGEIRPVQRSHNVMVTVHAPRWMHLNEIQLWSNGNLVESWNTNGASQIHHVLRGTTNSIVATVTGQSMITGEEIWGMSSPVLFSDNVSLEEEDTSTEQN